VGVLFGRRFDLGSFPWRTGLEPPCDLYVTSAIPSDQNPGGANNTGYSNPAFDQACLAALGALDEAGRRAQHIEAQAIFSQDLPSLPLFFRSKLGLTSARVQGYQLDSSAASDLWNVESLSLAEGE
jgi:peptide/nickel transport system substrate-binding protein